MAKGDTRRPSKVSKLEQYRRWEQTFGTPESDDMSKTHVRIIDEDGNEQWVLKNKD
jgi:hypothetical protein